MGILLKKATVQDSHELYELQILAFEPLLEKYNDFATNPGAETVDRTKERLEEKNSDYYFIQLDKKNIGGIRINWAQNTYSIKQIYILPQYQGQGYAQEAIFCAEAIYSNARCWRLDTIKQEEKLCYLYEKMGYKKTGKEERIKAGMTLVFYEKNQVM